MTYLGLDVSKQMFDATLLTATGTAHHHRFSNAPNGFELLQKWLGTHGVTTVHACMAATNIDWVALTKYLYALGYTVRVVNPARIKGFAMSEMQRNKNDKLDSATIAQFCLKHHPIMRSTIPKSSCWPTHSQASPNMQA